MSVAELREKVGKVGSVHVGAIEEYEELNQRHLFLTQQKEDLEKYLEDNGGSEMPLTLPF